ncbi:hypothetical protein F4861DRAFT_544696 [Xylaria intraflava]|nr:hypothetical protein F4861DRAFT_544696 [Xylaria intraflava]
MPSVAKADIEATDDAFRSEVINKLLESVDNQALKAPLAECLQVMTDKANHKNMARDLFTTVRAIPISFLSYVPEGNAKLQTQVTVYIAKNLFLDEEQLSVLCRTVKLLKDEWGHPSNVTSGQAKAPDDNGHVVGPTQDDSRNVTTPWPVKSEDVTVSAGMEESGDSNGKQDKAAPAGLEAKGEGTNSQKKTTSAKQEDGGNDLDNQHKAASAEEDAANVSSSGWVNAPGISQPEASSEHVVQEEDGNRLAAVAWQRFAADPQTAEDELKAAWADIIR